MRIAIVSETYYPGNNGQAIFTIHLAEGLAHAGHEVHAIIPSGDIHYLSETVNGVQVHKFRSINFDWIHPGANFAFLPAVQARRIFQKLRPDVIHIQDHYFLCRGVAQVARKMDIPIMGTNHFLPENLLPYLKILPLPRRLKIRILWDLMLWTYKRLDVVTTPTKTAAQILSSQPIHIPIAPISCGVDTSHFNQPINLDRAAACAHFGLDPEKIIFLYVGRLDGEKRIDLLLRALAHLRDRGNKEIRLAIAGQGAAKGELLALTHSLGLEERVRFLGYVPNEQLPLLYQTGHIFNMPSPEELQSIATLEAMASGLPILAANARALPELVLHGANGYLFEPGQAEAAAQGMAYLVEHRDQWERMGQLSRERAVVHSLENTIRRYEDIYCQAIALHDKKGKKLAQPGS